MGKKNYTNYSMPSESAVGLGILDTAIVDEAEPEAVPAFVTPQKVEEKTGMVTGCVKLNVRERPTTDSAILAVLQVGTMVTIVSSEVGWYRIKEGKTTGYVMANYIKVS